MKQSFALTAAWLLAATLNLHAQGSLTPPPGAPAPVMKTLDQVEARTPLVAGQPGVSVNGTTGAITITAAGSYYLTGNRTYTGISNGITITANDVVLDLNGFALINTTGSGTAVSIGGSNVTVRNGNIRGGTTVSGIAFTLAGWTHGIDNPVDQPNLVAEQVNVMGVRERGINLQSDGSRIDRCSTHTTGGLGLFACSISFSTARKAGSSAIIAALAGSDAGCITDCFGETLHPSYHGISATYGTVSNSRGSALDGDGISARAVSNSQGISTTGRGISAEAATNCVGTSTSGTGLYTQIADNSRGNSSSGLGLFAEIASNCRGSSLTGTYGLQAMGTASFCRGKRTLGIAIMANIAIGCTAETGTITANTNHLGTP